MRDSQLDILFEPLEMPNLTLKNRFFMAPMGTTFKVDQLTDYLVARAKGGVALITSGLFSVHPGGRAGAPGEPCLETDDDIKTFAPMVRPVQDAGARFVAQLNHVGRYGFARLLGRQSVAPSPIASRYTGETPRELATGEVDDMVVAFVEAAMRARKAGFDGVEFCANSGYLISQFLSPLTNRREDKYGGDTLKRATFLLSILRETRSRAGSDFNISVKFDAEDGMTGGKTLEESRLVVPEMVKAGADRLHVWAGWHESPRPMLPMSVERGAFSYLAAALRSVVDVPVATVGRINDPYVAVEILAGGEADLIGLGRPLLCDPDFVNKTMEGRTREIRRCIACCYCFDQMMRNLKGSGESELKCAMNPELGREGKGLIRPGGRRKQVTVIGGGPAGMEVARVAAVRGYDVTLFEEDQKLGGMVNLAYLPPHKGELKNVIDYYAHQMEVHNVNVKLGQSFTAETLQETAPDVLVLATGAGLLMPDISGIEGEGVMTALEVLKGTAPVGDIVVVLGGGMIGVETAEFLADQGKQVTVVEMLKSIASDVGPTTRWGLLSRLRRKVKILTSTTIKEIKEGNVLVEDRNNRPKRIPADTVVIAAGLAGGLPTGLTGKRAMPALPDRSGIEYHMVGSCRKPGQIAEAISEAFALGCRI